MSTSSSKPPSLVSAAEAPTKSATPQSRRSIPKNKSKFTRGEKCIFIHLVVTFCLILFLCLIYFIHLCLVNHSYREVVKISRRKMTKSESARATENHPVGYVFLSENATRVLCGAVLLSERWSAAPAHCAAARTDPDMASLLLSWRIRYVKRDNLFLESKIKRTIPHPHFDRNDFRNNVGLFEHDSAIAGIPHFNFSGVKAIGGDVLLQYAHRMVLHGWTASATSQEDERMELVRHAVSPVATAECARFMAPILDVRSYEHCVLLRRRDDDAVLDHGSVLVVESTVMGFFAWGEKSGKGSPCIVLDLQHYRTWMENIIAW